MNTPQGL